MYKYCEGYDEAIKRLVKFCNQPKILNLLWRGHEEAMREVTEADLRDDIACNQILEVFFQNLSVDDFGVYLKFSMIAYREKLIKSIINDSCDKDNFFTSEYSIEDFKNDLRWDESKYLNDKQLCRKYSEEYLEAITLILQRLDSWRILNPDSFNAFIKYVFKENVNLSFDHMFLRKIDNMLSCVEWLVFNEPDLDTETIFYNLIKNVKHVLLGYDNLIKDYNSLHFNDIFIILNNPLCAPELGVALHLLKSKNISDQLILKRSREVLAANPQYAIELAKALCLLNDGRILNQPNIAVLAANLQYVKDFVKNVKAGNTPLDQNRFDVFFKCIKDGKTMAQGLSQQFFKENLKEQQPHIDFDCVIKTLGNGR